MDTHQIWSVAKSVILIAGVIYIALVIILAVFQLKLIYYPVRNIEATPSNIGLAFEDIEFEAEGGIMLTGWFIPNDNQKGVILFCHGNAGNISHRLESIRIFHDLGLSVFIFDYRGYGKSNGKPSEKGTHLDVEAALRLKQPEIFNTDQGTQFTSGEFTGILQKRGIAISPASGGDGRGLCLDNIFVERLWRTVKYEEVYLHDYQTPGEACLGLKKYFEFYNTERFHQSLNYQTLYEVYRFGLKKKPEKTEKSGSKLQKDHLNLAQNLF